MSATCPGAGRLWTISCRSGRSCLTTDGTTVYFTNDGGVTWRARARALPTIGVPDLSCVPASTTCWAVGHYGPRIARTTDFGATWVSQTPPGGVGTLTGLDCPTTSACFAVGSTYSNPAAIATTDGGATWTKPALPLQSGSLQSISCPSAQACFAFGASYSRPIAFATTDAGASWALQDLGTYAGGSADVSCPTPSRCVAAGSGGLGFVLTEGVCWARSRCR